MTYYDHATYMAFKLDKWAEERTLRNYELEAEYCSGKKQAGRKDSNSKSLLPRLKQVLTKNFAN
jgi:hypothetical protein